ncbi:copper resistance protein CopC [Microbacterium sp. P05]|uniref:copper resistance CopC family protein n=1 Tax=Microbacterium sp. P05 TaxID=3366948 RepID=UPI0037476A0F
MTSPVSRAPRRTLATLVAGLLAAFVLLVPALPASAHDQLVASDPAADAVLEALPAQVTLTFSSELLGDATSNLVEVTDAAGTVVSDGPAVVDGVLLTQALTGEASGSLTVLWRVVSSDGHPISGEYAFTVEAAPSASPAPTSEPSATETPEPTMTTMTEPTETATPAPAPDDDTSTATPLPWIIGVVVLLAVIGVVLYLLVIRPRRTGTDGGAGTRPGADG